LDRDTDKDMDKGTGPGINIARVTNELLKMHPNIRRIKLTARARAALRKALRARPMVKQYISASADIARLRKDELVTLAQKVGIDVTSVIRNAGGIVFVSEEDQVESALYRVANLT